MNTIKKNGQWQHQSRVGVPDSNFYFTINEQGGVETSFNGQIAPTKQKLIKYRQALDELINEWDDSDYAEYNKLVSEDLDREMDSNKDREKPEPKPVRGWVYLLRCGNCYKIGKTKNLKTRLKKYVVENPYEIELVHKKEVNDYTKAETILHETVSEFNFRGEWYDLDRENVQLVISKMNKMV